MASHRLFCDINQLEEVLFFKDDYKYLSKIIEEFCDISLNFTDEEFLTNISKNPLLKKMFKRNSSSLIPDKKSYEILYNKDYSVFLNDIIILNEEDAVTEKIRDEYGILAINLNESFLEDQNFEYGFSIGDSPTSLKKCWSELFTDSMVTPVNSAIIIDNFLWTQISTYYEDNTNNIYPILKSIIPKSLLVPFHLTIVLQNRDGRLIRDKAKPMINKMKKFIKKEIGADIEISILTQTNTDVFHERVILTNYHYIYSEKGFVCFKNKSKVKKTNGRRNWVFKDINNYRGEIDKHKHLNHSLNVFKLIKENFKEEEKDTDTIFSQGNSLNPILSNFAI